MLSACKNLQDIVGLGIRPHSTIEIVYWYTLMCGWQTMKHVLYLDSHLDTGVSYDLYASVIMEADPFASANSPITHTKLGQSDWSSWHQE